MKKRFLVALSVGITTLSWAWLVVALPDLVESWKLVRSYVPREHEHHVEGLVVGANIRAQVIVGWAFFLISLPQTMVSVSLWLRRRWLVLLAQGCLTAAVLLSFGAVLQGVTRYLDEPLLVISAVALVVDLTAWWLMA